MSKSPRRVIAGVNTSGKSCVVAEDAIPAAAQDGMAITVVTTGPIGRTDNSLPLAPGFADFDMSQLTDEVYSMMFATYPPGLGQDDPGMHFTNTADHFYIIEGECVLVLEEDEAVLRAGDVGICRGAMHGWRNDTDKTCRLVTFVLPAEAMG